MKTQSKSKHTAGEWIKQDNPFKTDSGLGGIAVMNETGSIPLFYALINSHTSEQEAEANAKLISKSPALFEMVEKLKLTLSGYMAESETATPKDYELLEEADELINSITQN